MSERASFLLPLHKSIKMKSIILWIIPARIQGYAAAALYTKPTRGLFIFIFIHTKREHGNETRNENATSCRRRLALYIRSL